MGTRGWWVILGALVLAILAYHTGSVVTAEANRPAPLVTSVPISEKAVALTFDDGPTPKWTPKILELLKAEGVRATFFVIGQQAVKYPHLIAEEVESGMEIGNHGFDHVILRGKTPATIAQEVNAAAEAIEAAGAPAPRLYRLPAGVHDKTALTVLGELGYTVIGWSVDPRDWRHRYTADQMLKLVEKQVGPGRIIIFHDGTNGSQATVDAVRLVITTLRREGYRFVTVGQLLSLVKGRL
jgi:peptidoglycan/xylan/chitin deacetylase (PgdA/CDA1 family)